MCIEKNNSTQCQHIFERKEMCWKMLFKIKVNQKKQAGL